MKSELDLAYETDFPTPKQMKKNTSKLKENLIRDELAALRNRMMAATDNFIEVPLLSDPVRDILIKLGYTISTINSPIGLLGSTRTVKLFRISWDD